MSDTTNQAIIERVNQALNVRDWATLAELMPASFVDGLKALPSSPPFAPLLYRLSVIDTNTICCAACRG